MDNVCHTLVGVAVARAGLDRKTAMAATTAAIAANLPDIDVLVFLTGIPRSRSAAAITHGVPAQLLLPVACAGVDVDDRAPAAPSVGIGEAARCRTSAGCWCCRTSACSPTSSSTS